MDFGYLSTKLSENPLFFPSFAECQSFEICFVNAIIVRLTNDLQAKTFLLALAVNLMILIFVKLIIIEANCNFYLAKLRFDLLEYN